MEDIILKQIKDAGLTPIESLYIKDDILAVMSISEFIQFALDNLVSTIYYICKDNKVSSLSIITSTCKIVSITIENDEETDELSLEHVSYEMI